MKTLFIAILMVGSLSLLAQESKSTNPKLEALQNEKDQNILQQKINALTNGTVEDMELLIQYYAKDAAKKDALTNSLLKKYPHTANARMIRMMSLLKAKRPEDMEIHLQSLIKTYPGVNMDMEKNLVSSKYAEIPNANKVLEYVHSIQDPVFKVKALLMAVDYMELVDRPGALAMMRQELANTKNIEALTAPSFPLQLNGKATYYDFINRYGKLLFKSGKQEEAYKYTTEAYNHKEKRDAELSENYAFLSSKLESKYEIALPILIKALKDGKFEQRYMEEVRKGYEKLNPGSDGNAYVAELQKDFIDKIRSRVAPMIIDKPAPAFTVKDDNGKTVSLDDFKGKTIVLDFWATWCGPCVRSFPAMEMAANRYAKDPNVKFLFINSWENVKDPLTHAKTFLNKLHYTFDLYMDNIDPATKVSPAATILGVKLIPAKFIIDGEGKIRFSISGFSGKAEVAAEEVVQMIEMARK